MQGCMSAVLQGPQAGGLLGSKAARAVEFTCTCAVCRYLGSISSSKWVGEGPREGQATMENEPKLHETGATYLKSVPDCIAGQPGPYTLHCIPAVVNPSCPVVCSLAAFQCPTHQSNRPTTTALLHCGHPALRPHSPAALIHYIPRTPMRSRTGWTFMQQPSLVTHAPRRSIKRGVGGWVEGGGGD